MFYSGVFLMTSMRPFAAWQQFLQGVAVCQRLNALSPGLADETTDIAAKQAEESVYWSCWKSERELRIELDFPDFNAVHYDYPAMFPSLPQGCGGESLRAWYFYLAEISLWRIETTARQSMIDFVQRNPAATLNDLALHIEELETHLLSWHSSLPEPIRLDNNIAISEGENDVLRFILRGRLTYNYEVLTWPFLEMLIRFGQGSESPAMEIAARGAQVHYDRLAVNREGFYHRHHGTWLMQRSSARSAGVLLALARSQFHGLLPSGWSELVTATIHMMQFWGDDSAEGIAAFLSDVQADISLE